MVTDFFDFLLALSQLDWPLFVGVSCCMLSVGIFGAMLTAFLLWLLVRSCKWLMKDAVKTAMRE